MSIILGIDPGTNITGYGVLQYEHPRLYPLDFGCIKPSKKGSKAQKFHDIYNGIDHILEKYCPNAVAVETQFVKKNIQSTLSLGMACGIAMLAAAKRNIEVFEYAPTKIKKAVIGKGHASKEQVQHMIKMLLNLPDLPESDAADALAIAICHSHTFYY